MYENGILIREVSKTFSNKTIINNLNLFLEEKEIVAFIGANGSGKSTILKMIAGLIYQDEGTIEVFGVNNQNKLNLEICEFVLESGQGYYGYLSAYENARYFFGLNKIRFKSIQEKFIQLCKELEFYDHLYKKVDALSQGNRQKLSLIVSLLSHPKVLLLDEPTNGLDLKSVEKLADILLRENKENQLTILMTSHDITFMKLLNSRIIFIDKGGIKVDTTIKNVKTDNPDYTIQISNEELNRFKQEYPEILVSQKESYFEIKVNQEIKNKIVIEYDVLEFIKEDVNILNLFKETGTNSNVV